MTTQVQLEVNNQNNAAHIPEYITIQGTIQRIIFHNPQNGYTVLSISLTLEKETLNNVLDDEDIVVTDLKLTGHLAAPREGDEYRFTGTWFTHPRFGKQLKFTDAELLLPVGKSGVARYLSQITAGIGVKKAEKIVAALGEDALEQIRENPSCLDRPDLKFLTEEQKKEIVADLTKNSVQAELAALICGPGVGMGTVMRIMKEFGQDAVAKIKENPYVLCSEVYGIGFKTADGIALRTGIPKNSPFRVDAALLWVLNEAANGGHCYLRPSLIVDRLIGCRGKGVIAASGVDVKDIAESNQRLIDDGRCVREGDCVYLKKLWVAERIVAAKIKELTSRELQTIDAADTLKKLIADIESRDSVEYAPKQKEAIVKALCNAVSVVTGGPGTGKTTAINAIVDIYSRLYPHNELYLCAPTGRAAKRMSEAAGEEAKTIHRLLRYNPNTSSFEYGTDMPLPGPGLIIIDEASMIDVELAAVLLAAVNAGGKEAHQVVFVGDVDQLPSVGPGSVLRDLIASSQVPTTRLEFNYRQAGGSRIAELAHRVCQGEMISLANAGDFEFVDADDGDEAAETIKWLAETYVNAQGLSPLDWQVLVPMRRGSCGIKALNEALREIVNPVRANAPSLGGFRVGDKVMVIKNNYQLDVFNGDIGLVTTINKGNLTVDFRDREVEFPFEFLDHLQLAYASTIHKAQGSEFRLVIMGLCSQHYVMLQRNLIYTGMTRAKEKLILVGDSRSVAMAIKNNRIEERLSRLKERVAADA
jgi:exodeoxyribonuclease V alpha subunit